MKPAIMAQQLPSPLLLLAVWIIAGGVSMIGAVINAEIGVIYPETGGQYIYFRHLYGRFFSFLYGWAAFIVINTAAIAAIAFVFAEFSEYFKSTGNSIFSPPGNKNSICAESIKNPANKNEKIGKHVK